MEVNNANHYNLKNVFYHLYLNNYGIFDVFTNILPIIQITPRSKTDTGLNGNMSLLDNFSSSENTQ
jgi:hypothetical protein